MVVVFVPRVIILKASGYNSIQNWQFWTPSWICVHDCKNKHPVWCNNWITSLICSWCQLNNFLCGLDTCAETDTRTVSHFWRPSWFFASVQNCSNFCVWHSTDLDSAGWNHVETTKKLYICKKTWFHVFWHDFSLTIRASFWKTLLHLSNGCHMYGILSEINYYQFYLYKWMSAVIVINVTELPTLKVTVMMIYNDVADVTSRVQNVPKIHIGCLRCRQTTETCTESWSIGRPWRSRACRTSGRWREETQTQEEEEETLDRQTQTPPWAPLGQEGKHKHHHEHHSDRKVNTNTTMSTTRTGR